jgi:hypothetical protein
LETVIDIGCRNAAGLRPEDELYGASGQQAVLDAIWGEFSDRRVLRVDGTTVLKYWGPNARGNVTTAELLRVGDVQCGGWALLLVDVAGAQGVIVTKAVILPPPGPNDAQGALQINPTEEAQGGIPTVAFFVDHAVVEFRGKVYDPSYGTGPFSSRLAWEDASVPFFGALLAEGWAWGVNPAGTLDTSWP